MFMNFHATTSFLLCTGALLAILSYLPFYDNILYKGVLPAIKIYGFILVGIATINIVFMNKPGISWNVTAVAMLTYLGLILASILLVGLVYNGLIVGMRFIGVIDFIIKANLGIVPYILMVITLVGTNFGIVFMAKYFNILHIEIGMVIPIVISSVLTTLYYLWVYATNVV